MATATISTWQNRIVGYRDIPVAELVNNPRNWRIHPKHQQAALAGALREVGIVQNIIVNRQTGFVVDGHARAALALAEGQDTLPATEVELSADEEAVILATLDPIAAMAGADKDRLEALLAEVGTGPEGLDRLLGDLAKSNGIDLGGGGLTDPDDVPEAPDEPITQPGDLWLLGEHRLLCGDATNAEGVARVMAGERADLCFTSPPYATQRQYDGNLQPWDDLMRGVFGLLPMTDSGQVLVNIGLVHDDGEWTPYWQDWIAWMRGEGWRRFGWYVWDQGSGLPGDWNGRLAPSHEFIFHFNRTAQRANKTKATKLGGQMKTGNGLRKADGEVGAWTHVGRLVQPTKIPDSVVRVNRHSEFMEHVDHPAVFPVALATEIYAAFTSAGAITYDPLAGSGTCIVAAESLSMRCRAVEISPAYCDVIVARWEAFTGQTATRERREDAA